MLRSSCVSGTSDGLYELVRNHLGAIGDVWIALEENKDFATAERLGLELSEDFCLLDDIGWGEDDDRESFELTMPPHDLMEVLKRLHNEAEAVLLESGTERQSREEDAATNARFQLGLDTCDEVLVHLDERARPPARGSASAPASWTARWSPTCASTGAYFIERTFGLDVLSAG